jgi:hypothetical protein
MMIRGIDTDNYDGIIPVSHFQKLHDVYGVRFNIIGLEARMPFAKQQQDAGYAAGIDNPFAYKFPYWTEGNGPNSDLERFKEVCAFGKPIAPDIEYEPGLPGGGGANVERMHQIKDLLLREGLFWGWYSSPEMWRRLTNNTLDFAGDKGWSASYPFARLNEAVPTVPPIDYMPSFDHFPSFGGTVNEIWQYANACFEDGPWHLDLNAYQGEIARPKLEPVWLYGDKRAGRDVLGNQQRDWNNFVITDIHGDEAGIAPGRWMHNNNDTWEQLAP